MIKTYTIDPGQTATKEQLEEIEEAKNLQLHLIMIAESYLQL